MKGNMGVELISRVLEEAKECIRKEDAMDAMQASEKLYKASEEALKILSARFRLPEYEESKNKGRWTAPLLFSAVRKLSEEVSPDIVNWWDHAWFLHVEGFHEARLNIEEVKFRLRFVEELVRLAKK